jgi:hypothetical protein
MICLVAERMEAGRPLFIRLSLPPGLEEALEGLAREILRSKTDNILHFAADYFDNLVKIRGEKGTQKRTFRWNCTVLYSRVFNF